MFAQAVADPSAVAADLVGVFLPVVMVFAPFVLALLTKVTSDSNAKKALSALLAVAVAGLSLAVDPPASITIPVIATRLLASWPILETSYRVWNALLRPITSKGLNGLMLPDVGIQLGKAQAAVAETSGKLRDALS
jgi:hypothetical protein